MNQAALHKLLASGKKDYSHKELFEVRLATNLSLIQELFFSIYPEKEYSKTFKRLLTKLEYLFESRSDLLREQDLDRIKNGNWYQSEKMVGMQLYVDHFNKNLKGLENKLSYLEDLGVNFVHVMPLMTRPKGENDGGYAVNSYIQIDKKYGSKKDFEGLTSKLREKGMYLMLDFVANHTSDEHLWAKKAKEGKVEYQQYYYTHTDRALPNEYEKTLPEVFPQTSPGNYTFVPEMGKWVMTVFNSYQWDLNYTNPIVFLEMLANLVKLANMGVDIVRFDALAFLWKKLGTISQNLPEAHTIIALFRMCLQVVAPGTILLAEAIVAPNDIIKYFGEGNRRGNECEVAYNASLMALLWNSIATKKTSLLYKSLTNIPKKPKECTWINYIRCHDDIGLGLDDRFIEELGWNPTGHRRFLLDYYCQRLDWSPAMGLLFMDNPKTGDGRITGSAASLLGLEKGLENNETSQIQKAIDKILLLHGIILSFGGIPLIYGGDEIGALNDYSFLEDSTKKGDSRWVNRPKHNWSIINQLPEKDSPQATIFYGLKKLISLRKHNSAFADDDNLVLHYSGNEHLLMYERTEGKMGGILVLCNFDEFPQVVESSLVRNLGYLRNEQYHDLISNDKVNLQSGLLEILPYQLLWLRKQV